MSRAQRVGLVWFIAGYLALYCGDNLRVSVAGLVLGIIGAFVFLREPQP